MNRCCVYKLKEGKQLNKMQEMFTRYVYVENFARNPLKPIGKENTMVVYKYINIETLRFEEQMLGLDILSVDEFKEHFELYWDVGQINNRLCSMSEDR